MMRICDILYAIPYLLVVILLTVIRGSGIATILIAMTSRAGSIWRGSSEARSSRSRKTITSVAARIEWGVACADLGSPSDPQCDRPDHRRRHPYGAHRDFHRSVFKLFRARRASSRCELGRDGQRWLERDALLSVAAPLSFRHAHFDHALL